MGQPDSPVLASVLVPCTPGNFHAALAFFTDSSASPLGQHAFILLAIFPADAPCVAVAEAPNGGLRLRLDAGAAASGAMGAAPQLLVSVPASHGFVAGSTRQFTAPGGVCVLNVSVASPEELLPVHSSAQHSPIVSRASGQDSSWTVGRAGMMYRDLIPSRLNGRYIASHIRIPEGGPVPDYDHWHSVAFQCIFVYRGWVDVVYEGQGAPFRMLPGDCVLQPPGIRHRVLESGDGLEVVEIGSPAEHLTLADNGIALPTSGALTQPSHTSDAVLTFLGPKTRRGGSPSGASSSSSSSSSSWGVQTFCRHQAELARGSWAPDPLLGPSFQCSSFGFEDATGGLASARRVRPAAPTTAGSPTTAESRSFSGLHRVHSSDLLFFFVLEGKCAFSMGGDGATLGPADSVCVPAGESFSVVPDANTELLVIAMLKEAVSIPVLARL